MFVDMWYGHKVSEVDRITVSFSDTDCIYRGNLFVHGRCVGDFTAKDSLEIEKKFGKVWLE